MRAPAPAKINLALVVGPARDDGKHELVTVYQRIGLADRIELEQADSFRVDGFLADTLVRAALESLAAHARIEPRWRVHIEKRLPVAAGLGGGSSDAAKHSTAAVYADFDARDGAAGFDERCAALHGALAQLRRPRNLAALPANDLASSPLTSELRTLGAFRADVSGAGPAVYGLFHHKPDAQAAERALKRVARTWITTPAWYG